MVDGGLVDDRFVLVIEDDRAIRDLMVDLLTEAGYPAQGVVLASQAGEYLSDPSCSLIVTDLNAPFYTPENRDEVWRESLGLLRTDRRIPIIVVTAHSAAAQEDA